MKEEKPFYEIIREIDEVCGGPVGKSPVQIFEEGRQEGVKAERERLKKLYLETFGIEFKGDYTTINFTDRQKEFLKELSKEHK